MKTRLLFCVALAACAQLQAQTNTFPASGNVGVGTSTPADSLDVVGTTTALSGPAGQVGTSYLQMSPGSTPTLLLVKSVSAWGDTWWNFAMQPNNSLILGFSSVPQVVFQNGQADFYGNVGIGTTTPQAALDVNGDIYQSVGTSADTIHGANKQATRSVGQTTLGSDSAGSSAFVGMKTQVFSGQGSEAANQADIEFFTWGNSYAGSREVMRIRSSGSVGIGTTTPLAPLSVNGNIFNQKGFGSSIGMYSGSSDPASFAITAGQPGTSVSGTILGQNWIANSGGSAMQQADSSYNSSAIVFNSGTANYGGMQFQQFNVGASSVINSFVIDGSITPVANTLYLTGGNVGIGTTNPQAKLDVQGAIHAHEVIVDTTGADYVFEPAYRLASLSEVEGTIKRDGHLPGIPSAQAMSSGGVSVGDLQTKLLAKVEELTLHMIAQQKELDALKTENAAMQARLNTISK